MISLYFLIIVRANVRRSGALGRSQQALSSDETVSALDGIELMTQKELAASAFYVLEMVGRDLY